MDVSGQGEKGLSHDLENDCESIIQKIYTIEESFYGSPANVSPTQSPVLKPAHPCRIS